MQLYARAVLALLAVLAVLSTLTVSAAAPRSLAERKGEIRDRMIRSQAMRQAAYEKREADFYNRRR
jgi:hypothetical protein